MKENEFNLTDKQKDLCHQLTMEFLRQNDTLKVHRDINNKITSDFDKITFSYFNIYEEFAIAINEHWHKIQGTFFK